MTRMLLPSVALIASMLLHGCCAAPGEPEPTAEEIAAAERAQEQEYARIEYVGRFEQSFSEGGAILDVRAEGPRHEVLAIVSPGIGQSVVDVFSEGSVLIEEVKSFGFESMRFEDSDTKREWVLVLAEIPNPVDTQTATREEERRPASNSVSGSSSGQVSGSSSPNTASDSERASSGSGGQSGRGGGVSREGDVRRGGTSKRVAPPRKGSSNRKK